MLHCYKLGGYNIVLDTASGAIHSVDEAAYDAICMYERAGKAEIEEYIRGKYTDIREGEIAELLFDIEELIRNGKLFSPEMPAGALRLDRRTSLKALCLNVSHMCNMTCGYCFAGSGHYGGEGELMSLETGTRAIDFLLENSGEHKNLDVDFFGGEPLMNWGVVKELVKYARAAESGSGKRFRFTLTTNGLLIDDDVIEFTNREMRNVVLSLDGRPETNDAFRRLPDGGGSFHDVLPKLQKFVGARGDLEYYIRGTYTRRNMDFLNDILYLARLGFTELSLEPVVAKPGVPYALTSGDLPKLREQYEKLAFEMLAREKEGGGFTFYHYMLDLTRGPCAHKRAAGCGVGAEYMAVTPRGELYPCHQFVGDESFLLGDIWRGVTSNELRGVFAERNIFTRAECRECWARMYCSGGCAANAYSASGDVNGVYELGCELFKTRVECAIMMKVAQSVAE